MLVHQRVTQVKYLPSCTRLMVLIWSSTFTFGHRQRLYPPFWYCNTAISYMFQMCKPFFTEVCELACCFKRSLVRFTPIKKFAPLFWYLSASDIWWEAAMDTKNRILYLNPAESGRVRQSPAESGRSDSVENSAAGCPRCPLDGAQDPGDGGQCQVVKDLCAVPFCVGVYSWVSSKKKILGHGRNIL